MVFDDLSKNETIWSGVGNEAARGFLRVSISVGEHKTLLCSRPSIIDWYLGYDRVNSKSRRVTLIHV